MSSRHEPVLLDETLAFLAIGPGLYLDATLGDAGHAEALLDRQPDARLLGCDRDVDALQRARARLDRFGERVMLAHATFRELPGAHAQAGSEPFTGALFDLGLSSRQIDDADRGMSFQSEGPLDLRMDRSRGMTAREMLAEADADEVAAVLRTHGDLRSAARLAREIVAEARRGGLPTTRALAAVIDRALGGRPHPRRHAQVFQALRIWVNGEGEDLDAALGWLPGVMRPAGVVVTLAYHSGEDRKIKQALRGEPRVSRRLPFNEVAPTGPWEELTRRVVKPSESEVAANPRARSARLRAFRRKAA